MQDLISQIKESPLDVEVHEMFRKQYDRFCSRDKIPTEDLFKYLNQARQVSGFEGEYFDKVLNGRIA